MALWEPRPRGPDISANDYFRVPFSTQHASSDASGVAAAPCPSPERLAAVKRPPRGRPNRAAAHFRTARRPGPARCWRSLTRSMIHAPPRSFEDRVAVYGTDLISGSGAQDKMPCARKWMHSGNDAAPVWHLPPLPEAAGTSRPETAAEAGPVREFPPTGHGIRRPNDLPQVASRPDTATRPGDARSSPGIDPYRFPGASQPRDTAFRLLGELAPINGIAASCSSALP